MPTREQSQSEQARKDHDLAQLAGGLDALDAAPDGRRRRFDITGVLAPVAVVVALILLWQVACWAHLRPTYIVPTPSSVASNLWGLITHGTAWEAIWVSVHRGLIGFLASIVIGTVLGALVSQVALLRKGFRPLLSAMQSLPSVAWVPFALVIFQGGPALIYAVVLLGSVPSIANGLIGGVDQTPPLLREAGKVLGAGRFELMRSVLLPAALPTYLTGLKQGWSFAWRSLMAAELVATSAQLGTGLGGLLSNGSQDSDMPTVLSAIILILLVGVVVELAVFDPIERHVLRRRGLTSSGL